MDELFVGIAEVEGPKDDPWIEHKKRIDERSRTILNALHVSKELTFDRKIVISGNKIDDGRGGRVYLSVGDERIDELPNARTKKGDLIHFGRQDALDAAVALANIVEIVAPYAWEEGKKKAQEKAIPIELGYGLVHKDPNPERYAYPAEALKSMSKESPGWNLLVSEVASFVDRFGLLHMSSSERRWDNDSWLYHENVMFYGDDGPLTFKAFKADWNRRLESEIRREVCVLLREKAHEEADSVGDEAVREKYQSVIAKIESERNDSYAPKDIQGKAQAFIIGREKKALEPFSVHTLNELYALHLSRYVKSFKNLDNHNRHWKNELKRLAFIEKELDLLENKWNRVPYWEDEDEEQAKKREEKISELHKERSSVFEKIFDALEEASRQATKTFDDKAKKNLAEYGIWEVDLYNFYSCSLLVHDALEMLRAIDGDESAFRRMLPRFHMERFWSRGEEDFARYILWFESIGSDADNPLPYGEKYVYAWEVDGKKIDELVRRRHPRRTETFGGTDWLYYWLCDSTDGLGDFERLVRENLPFFAEKIISDGKSRNYNGRFAPGADVSRNSLVYTVNDRDCDLMATIWSALDFVRTKDVELNLSQCEVCGRLMRVKKQQRGGKLRKTCSDACRQSLSRGKVDKKATKLRDDFNSFMESGAEIRIGVDEPPKEVSLQKPNNMLDVIFSAISQAKRR